MDGTAIAPDDYTSVITTLALQAGQASLSVTVNTTSDNILEGSESFGVSLSNPSVGISLGELTIATVNIQDATGE